MTKTSTTTNPRFRGKPLAMRLLIIFSLTLVLIVCASVSRGKTEAATAAVQDWPSADPSCGSEVGNTLRRACGNCHSNQTNLPWYGHVPPISWWIRGHVLDARKRLNFSAWRSYSLRERRDELQSMCGVIMTGRMPPSSYTTMHPEAKLKAQEKDAVCAWTTMEIEQEK